MKFVHLKNIPIFQQLELEEALLRSASGEWCLVNSGSSPAIVLGISGKVEELVQPHCPLPLIRRFSGGGTVVIDHNTLFLTFLGSMPHPTPSKIHEWAFERLSPVFHSLPFELRENDYVLNEKKCGGNAQYIAKDRFLHHTSLLWDYNPELMDYLKMPPKMPSYRDKRSHQDFLTTLSPHFDSKEIFLENFQTQLNLKYALSYPQDDELSEILNTPHRKSLLKL